MARPSYGTVRDSLPAELGADELARRADLRSVLGMFATGITVLSTNSKLGPHGMTANSFTSVSLAPPLVLVCVLREASMHQAILDCQSFGISVLGAGQKQLARYFADHTRPRDEREFDVVDWLPGAKTGVPIIDGSLAWIECGLRAAYDGGDHSIFVGSVLDTGRRPGQDALLYFGGGYRELEPDA